VTFESTTSNRFLQSSSGILEQNEWHDVAFTFGPEGLKLYINSELVDTDSNTEGIIGNREPLVIGASTKRSSNLGTQPLENFFQGSVDEVALFNTQLSPQEITEIHIPTETPPTVRILSPLDGSTVPSNIVVEFETISWDVGGKGFPHIHFHLSDVPDYTFEDHFMFYNSPDSVVEFNTIPGATPFATRISQNTIQFNNVPVGLHQLRARLVNSDHSLLENPESIFEITVTVDPSLNVQDPEPDYTLTVTEGDPISLQLLLSQLPNTTITLIELSDETNFAVSESGLLTNILPLALGEFIVEVTITNGNEETSTQTIKIIVELKPPEISTTSSTSGSSSSSSSSTKKKSNGGCYVFEWDCTEWNPCSQEGDQSRTCTPTTDPKWHCYEDPKKKPVETQDCEIVINEQPPVIQEEKTLNSVITGAVAGAQNTRKVIGATAFILILVCIYFFSVGKNKSLKGPTAEEIAETIENSKK
jgi:hypothetical protein